VTRWRSLFWIVGIVAAALMAALVVGIVVRNNAASRVGAEAAADARLRQTLMASEIARFRLLPLALGDDRDVVALIAGAPNAQAVLNAKLERLARDVGAAVIYVIRRDGLTLAASNWRDPDSFLGKDYSFRPYFTDAARNGAAEQYALGTVSRKPGLFLARRGTGGSVVVVKLEFDRIEDQWRAAGGITFVTDSSGVILVTSRPDWRFAATRPLPPAERHVESQKTGSYAIRPSPFRALENGRISVAGQRRPLDLTTTAPDKAGWRVNLALPTRAAVDAEVRSAQIAATLTMLVLGGLAAWGAQRATRRRERTAALEAAVAERTADLRREIDERVAAETRAAELREGLRQANRLATLGQVTASVAHETAQPVAAIRNYAATSRQLLDRGSTEEVRANLQVIDRLAERIGTVTAQLRGFARKGNGGTGPVPLAEVVEGARLLLKERLTGVDFVMPAIPAHVRVIGGQVRLEQVLVNLLQNAIEALAGQPDPRLAIRFDAREEEVRLIVTDNGPGIAPDVADRLFTPFATSRANGLGLGLVIAQDIATEFGGSLRLEPSERGACFVVTLRRAP